MNFGRPELTPSQRALMFPSEETLRAWAVGAVALDPNRPLTNTNLLGVTLREFNRRLRRAA